MRGNRTLALVLGLLLLPFVVAASLYAVGWHPDSAGNHGELLSPPRDLPPLVDARGAPLVRSAAPHWRLVIAGAGPCDDACRKWIVLTRQVHVALYKQMSRVERTWLTDQANPNDAALLTLQPDLHTAVAADAASRAAFDLESGGHRVYVVDPEDRIILRYASDADPRGILKDMERLLRYAWAG
ncbi:hypothetical protein [Zoogloea sp.]|uniref:hypothetical protein n=1 Tax=Zoogloea sp. TaxID=49181 RepID=UPI001AD10374|nr:hypothetical protein [Zoogloea sp.]MBN8283974.1 hypothetical protein [Zoogloea sp.]